MSEEIVKSETEQENSPVAKTENGGAADPNAVKDVRESVRKSIIERKMKEEGLDQASAEAAADEALQKLDKKAEEKLAAAQAAQSIREFDSDFLKVYMEDPFIGTISLEVTKIIDTKMPTAYVGIRPNAQRHEVIMGVNPDFFRSLSPRQRQGVLKHEMYHLIFSHIFERAPGDKDMQTLWNWATDLAINSIIGIDNLPDACLFPGKRPMNPETGKPIEGPYAEFIEKAPALQASDFYFQKLREIHEEEKKNGNSNSIEVAVGSGMGTMDDHGAWGDLPPEVREQVRDRVRDMLEKAVKRAERSNSWGTVPQEIQDVIRKMLSREIDWRSVLRNFIGRCRTMDRLSTIKRLNKKVPYGFPGYKRKYKANFACFIDQSGSMSDEDIAMLFCELESFAQETELEVYHFDTEIDKKSKTLWKRGRPFPPAHRTRCGGTDFNCIAKFCNSPENRGKWSGIVILTDGYAPTMGQVVGSRVIWVITEHGTMDAVRRGDLAVQMKKAKKFKRY